MSQEGKALWAGLIFLSPRCIIPGLYFYDENLPRMSLAPGLELQHQDQTASISNLPWPWGLGQSELCEEAAAPGHSCSSPSSLALLLGSALPYKHEAGMRCETRAPRRAAAAPGCRVISMLWHNKCSFSLKWLCRKCLRCTHLAAVCSLQGRLRAHY